MTLAAYKNDPWVMLDGQIIWWHGLMPYRHRRQTVTKRRIGNTLFVVTSECDADATETMNAKLERLMTRYFSDTNCYQLNTDISLASMPNQSKYRVGEIKERACGYERRTS